jgi:hypothetical protein
MANTPEKKKANYWQYVPAGASQFLSRRSVPKEQSKIARHFNAGNGLENSSPAETVEKKHRFQPSLRDAAFFGCPKVEMRPLSSSLSAMA